MSTTKLIARFRAAKRDNALAVIEGAQALKHALRFKAEIIHIATADKRQLQALLDELAPDVSTDITATIIEVATQTFQQISPRNHRTKVVTLAKRHHYQLDEIDVNKPIIFLEDPKDLENIGAVIRVAAAANVGAVVSSGEASVWHPAVIRGGAGLHYAVPVFNARLEDISMNRVIVALDPNGKDIRHASFPENAVLIFGTERYGITKETLAKADHTVQLPMQEGVSSLNLATSVATTLYGRMSRG